MKKGPILTAAKGFTLIELIVVFSVMAILGSLSIAAFEQYNYSQQFSTSVESVVSMINSAKSKSLAGIVPAACANESFNGYQVVINPPSTYELEVLCQGNATVISQSALDANVTFSNNSSPKVVFQSVSGIVTQQYAIGVTGYGQSNVITVAPPDTITTASGQLP